LTLTAFASDAPPDNVLAANNGFWNVVLGEGTSGTLCAPLTKYKVPVDILVASGGVLGVQKNGTFQCYEESSTVDNVAEYTGLVKYKGSVTE
jgi:hypothetical protein